jgi:hypothetical protein
VDPGGKTLGSGEREREMEGGGEREREMRRRFYVDLCGSRTKSFWEAGS